MKEIVRWFTVACALVAAGSSLAQGFPNKPIRIIFGFQPGTIQDAVALYVEEVRSGRFPGREHSF